MNTQIAKVAIYAAAAIAIEFENWVAVEPQVRNSGDYERWVDTRIRESEHRTRLLKADHLRVTGREYEAE